MENQSWEEAGDEAVLLKNNLKDVPVYVSWRKKNKAHAANYLSEKSGCDIVILDDAFQHRKTGDQIESASMWFYVPAHYIAVTHKELVGHHPGIRYQPRRPFHRHIVQGTYQSQCP